VAGGSDWSGAAGWRNGIVRMMKLVFRDRDTRVDIYFFLISVFPNFGVRVSVDFVVAVCHYVA
jgi:hypothetical protein